MPAYKRKRSRKVRSALKRRKKTKSYTKRKRVNSLKRVIRDEVSQSQVMAALGEAKKRTGNAIGVAAIHSLQGFTRSELKTIFEGTCPNIDGTTITYTDMTQDAFTAKALPRFVECTVEMVNTQQYPQKVIAFLYQCKTSSANSAQTELLQNYDRLMIDATEAKISTAETYTLFPMTLVPGLQHWARIKKLEFILKPGESRVLKGVAPMSKFYGGADMQKHFVASTYNYVKGFSLEWVLQVRGLPIYDSSNRDNVTYSETESHAIVRNHVKYRISIKGRHPRKVAVAWRNLSTVLVANQRTVSSDIQRVEGAIPADPST